MVETSYKNAKIYKILNHVNDEVYVGSTTQALSKRMSCHRGNTKLETRKNKPLYKLMNEIGVDSFYIELIEDYSCDNIEQLLQREGFYIRQIGTLNKIISGRTKSEYREENKEHILENYRKYRETHKEHIALLNSEKTVCECGSTFNRQKKAKHQRTTKHQSYLNSLSTENI